MAEENDSEEESKGFKVSDRRFSVRGYEDEDEGGNDAVPEPPPGCSGSPMAASEVPPAPEAPPSPEPAGGFEDKAIPGGVPEEPEAPEEEGVEKGSVSREFETLLAILQTNAMAAMGINPQTGERVGGADPRSAKMFVDLVAMVKEKMKGNLSENEEKMMAQIISDLQMMYVQQVGIG